MHPMRPAFIAGLERLSAWADALDRINVFPVVDGDTGYNLVISLAPLRGVSLDDDQSAKRLLQAARGNSGNIAAPFFSSLIQARAPIDLAAVCHAGRNLARQAIDQPVDGTLLTVFDALATCLDRNPLHDPIDCEPVLNALRQAVRRTPDQLPVLKQAGVVDAGALGIYLFMEGFFHALARTTEQIKPLTATFAGQLRIRPRFSPPAQPGYCVEARLRSSQSSAQISNRIGASVHSLVAGADDEQIKLHFHTAEPETVKKKLAQWGHLAHWRTSELTAAPRASASQPVHIVTDAAGSLTRDDAQQLGITLLSSYIGIGRDSLPESACNPARLYAAMRQGTKVSTAQASNFERCQHYERLIEQHPHVLYICVGSVYTGNFHTARQWQQRIGCQNRFTIMDTGYASGRLGMLAHATAQFAQTGRQEQDVLAFARRIHPQCHELVFLDRLRYLAANGRISTSQARLADWLRLKPIITPTAQGVKKLGMARSARGQLKFACNRMRQTLAPDAPARIWLQYSDNHDWLRQVAAPRIKDAFPMASIQHRPLSLTSGAHMGPGTWAVAFWAGGQATG